MHRIVVRLAPWIVLALMGGPTALAQEPPPPLPAEPMPAPETTAVEPVAKGDEAPVEAPPPEEEAPSGTTGWFRIDSDIGGLQLWAGASHPLTDRLSLATDIYVYGDASASYGEFDIGPAISLGPIVLTPMIGFQINFTTQRAAAVVPQLYTILDAGPLYFESWIQIYIYDAFAADGDTTSDFLHTRDFLLLKLGDALAVGLEVDANFALNNKMNFGDETVYWLPVGPHVKLNYGEASTLELFVGYDLVAKDQDKDDLAGRFTFVQTW
jgi:hypothetical protein